MTGTPTQEHESIYPTWLALGGATASRTERGAAMIVAAGTTAATTHAIGDFFPDGYDFIVPSRKDTRLPGVRLRIRTLERYDVIPVAGLPTLTVERTIGDLVEIGTDTSLVADAPRDAVRADKIVHRSLRDCRVLPGRLGSCLSRRTRLAFIGVGQCPQRRVQLPLMSRSRYTFVT